MESKTEDKLKSKISEMDLAKDRLKESLSGFLEKGGTKSAIELEVNKQLTPLVKKEVEKESSAIKEGLNSQIKNIADRSFEELRSKLERDRLNVIQATSIITVFIAFLIIEFDILISVNNVKNAIALSIILVSLIMLFVLLIDLVIKVDLPFKRVKKIGGMGVLGDFLGGLIPRHEGYL